MSKNTNSLLKTTTGVENLDEITNGGFPTGRTTLVCSSAGSGKTIPGMECLVRGMLDYDEPGVNLKTEGLAWQNH